eukprot:6176316-Pleurochrysis_carterae.AAC.7
MQLGDLAGAESALRDLGDLRFRSDAAVIGARLLEQQYLHDKQHGKEVAIAIPGEKPTACVVPARPISTSFMATIVRGREMGGKALYVCVYLFPSVTDNLLPLRSHLRNFTWARAFIRECLC